MGNPTDNARKFLESLQRTDLATLIRPCEVGMVEFEIDDPWPDLNTEAVVHAPSPIDKALSALPEHDRKRIAEAIASGHPNASSPSDIRVRATGVDVDDAAARLLADLVIHREMMISVATGGDRIQDVDDYYRVREVSIRQALPATTTYENPHPGLWDWYHYWSASLPSYKDRRLYIRNLFAPTIDAVSRRSSLSVTPREPTGWERVDRALSKARTQLQQVSAEEDCQAIGLMCREVIISLAQAVFDPDIHEPLDGVRPSETDANRMLGACIAHVFPGASNKEVRAHARASLALALNLQHRRTATRQLAALCVEATASTVAILHIIASPKDAPAGQNSG